METNEHQKGIKFSFKNSIDYSQKAVVSKHILKKETGTISLFAFDKGEGLSEHTAPFDALVYIVEGKADVIIGGKSFVLEANEAIIMPANVSHAMNALEHFKMVLTMIKK
ncbi:MAG TPA: cupin domain-containing protein [Bacteroidales bacterium]|nr:cupin domain-containing protein [Bacteroidales bacterium]